jgi:hypothetical protein
MHSLKVIFGGFLAAVSVPASWALDWRRSSDRGRHYDQVFSLILASGPIPSRHKS